MKRLDRIGSTIKLSSLSLFDRVFFCKILMPLLMEDKLNVIERYLAKSVEQQKNFIKLLDSMCSGEFHMSKLLAYIHFDYRFKI